MTQLDLIPRRLMFHPVPPPQLRGFGGELDLPERVRLISLNQPYCGLCSVADPENRTGKWLETRTWPWPYDPSWLALYATKKLDKQACERLGNVAAPHHDPRGVVLALVWIGGCRPMCEADEVGAMYPYEPGRFVWHIGKAIRLRKPIPLDRGPQKFSSLPRELIARSMFAVL